MLGESSPSPTTIAKPLCSTVPYPSLHPTPIPQKAPVPEMHTQCLRIDKSSKTNSLTE